MGVGLFLPFAFPLLSLSSRLIKNRLSFFAEGGDRFLVIGGAVEGEKGVGFGRAEGVAGLGGLVDE